MGILTLRTIAILTVIAIGFMVTEPFVEETAEASCNFYPASECTKHLDFCIERLDWADLNCPGANDAGVQRCIELTEQARRVCSVAIIICYHSEPY